MEVPCCAGTGRAGPSEATAVSVHEQELSVRVGGRAPVYSIRTARFRLQLEGSGHRGERGGNVCVFFFFPLFVVNGLETDDRYIRRGVIVVVVDTREETVRAP